MTAIAVSLLIWLLQATAQTPTEPGDGSAAPTPADRNGEAAPAASGLCATLIGAPSASIRAAQAPRVHVELEALPNSRIKRSLALARIAAPAYVVFRIVTDYEHFGGFFPLVLESRLHAERGKTTLVYQIIDLPFPISNRHYVIGVENTWGPTYRGRRCYESRWEYQPGSGNIDDTYGRWEVLEDGADYSLVAYVGFIDPGGRVPAWTYNWSTGRALPRLMRALRAEARRRLSR